MKNRNRGIIQRPAHNSTYKKLAVQCTAEISIAIGMVNQNWFSASIPIAIGMVKIATFAKLQTIIGHFKKTTFENERNS